MKYIQERTVIIAGVILVLLPFSGFPRGWKMWITGLVGLVLIFVGTLLWKKAHPIHKTDETRTQTFTETTS